MNRGQFSSSINESWKLFKVLDLAGEINSIPQKPANPGGLFRGKTYIETYKICLENFYYQFQLADGSLMQFDGQAFSSTHMQLRYAYYESPYKSLTFDEYLFAYGVTEITEEEISKLYSMYQEDISSIVYSTLKKQVFPIRYDYSVREHNEGLHPVSHFHFGYNNNVRIATRKILSPLSFCLLLIRQCYPDNWIKFHKLSNWKNLAKHIRDNLGDVDQAFWKQKDLLEMHLY